MGRISLHPGCEERQARQIELAVAEPEEGVEFDPESSQIPDTPFAEDIPDYNSYNVAELKVLCRERGLGVSGSKSELVQRLDAADTDSTEAPTEEVPVEEEEVGPSEEAPAEGPKEGDVSESGGETTTE